MKKLMLSMCCLAGIVFTSNALEQIKRPLPGSNVLIEVVANESQPANLIALYQNNQLVFNATFSMAQFEKKGVGYQGSGYGWPYVNQFKSLTMVKKNDSYEQWLLSAKFAGKGIGAERDYDVIFDFYISKTEPVFAIRLKSLTGCNDVAVQLKTYSYMYFLLSKPGNVDLSIPDVAHVTGSLNILMKSFDYNCHYEHNSNNCIEQVISPAQSLLMEKDIELNGFGPLQVFKVIPSGNPEDKHLNEINVIDKFYHEITDK